MTVVLICFVTNSSDSYADNPISNDGIEYLIEGENVAVTHSDLQEVIIPTSIEYEEQNYPVTRIADNAFAGNSQLSLLWIPASVTSIGSGIVSNCQVLSYIALDESTIPDMATDSLTVSYPDCNIYTNFSMTEEQLRMYIGGADIGNYELHGRAALLHYKDVKHSRDVYNIWEYYESITVSCPIACTHCTLVSWGDGYHTYHDGDLYELVESYMVLIPVVDEEDVNCDFYDRGEYYLSRTSSYHSDPIVPSPERDGYELESWVKTELGPGERRYDASWSPLQFTIYFDTNGGSPVESIQFDCDQTIVAPSNPTKTGHTFDGWQPSLPTVMGSSDLHVQATWVVNSYEIKFIDGTEVISQLCQFGSALSIPSITRTGYHLTLDQPLADTVPDYGLEYTIIWIPNNYTISFFDGTTMINQYDGEYDSDILFPSVNRTGYHPNWGSITTVPAQDIEIHLEWVINQHTASFSLPNGVTDIVREYNSRIVPPEPGKKVGYYFDGWSPSVPEYMPDSDLVFESIWRPTLKPGEGEDANRFISSGGDSVTVCKSDLAGLTRVTFGIEGKWYVTFDTASFSGDDNLMLSITEVPKDSVRNVPKGTSSVYLMEMEDGGRRVLDSLGTITVSIPIDVPSGKVPFVYLMAGEDPVSAEDVTYADGSITFSLSSPTYLAAGYADPDEPAPVFPIVAVAIAVFAVAAAGAFVVIRRGRKV